jgi:cytochrome c-type biogenesis protein CcmH
MRGIITAPSTVFRLPRPKMCSESQFFPGNVGEPRLRPVVRPRHCAHRIVDDNRRSNCVQAVAQQGARASDSQRHLREGMTIYFWYAAGILTGVAAAFIMVPLARSLAHTFSGRKRRFAFVAVVVAAFAATVFIAYHVLGRPDAVNTSAVAINRPHPGARQPAAREQTQSLEIVASRLEERLMREGGNDSDWQLLAQTYEMLGRPDDAARVRAQSSSGAGPAPMPAAVDSGKSIAALEAQVGEAPRDAQAWLELATIYRHQRKFEQSRAAFDRLIALHAMNADAWADYADVLATLSGGSVAGEPARAIDRALALDAQHPKALWLKASLAHEQGRYRDSLAIWKQLRATLPATSPDAAIIDANIAEAAALARQPGSSSASPPVQVSGTVSIDKALVEQVASGATLFIYAKAADSPGPPLAVFRVSPTSWPVNFRLDDTLAMLPARKLSDFKRVIVEARISRSGQAARTPGDFYVESPVLQPADGKQLQLVISRVIS